MTRWGLEQQLLGETPVKVWVPHDQMAADNFLPCTLFLTSQNGTHSRDGHIP